MVKIHRAAATPAQIEQIQQEIVDLPLVSQWPVFVGTLAEVNAVMINPATFTRIPVEKGVDTHNGFNAAERVYKIPQTGLYRIEMKIRYYDAGYSTSLPAGISIGVGAGVGEYDSPSFFWGVTNPARNGLLNQTIASFNAGDGVRLFTYQSGSAAALLMSAEMTIDRIR